jgi:predicted transcriptional regulator
MEEKVCILAKLSRGVTAIKRIAEECHVNRSSVYKYLEELEIGGYIEHEAYGEWRVTERGLRYLADSMGAEQVLSIDLLNKVRELIASICEAPRGGAMRELENHVTSYVISAFVLAGIRAAILSSTKKIDLEKKFELGPSARETLEELAKYVAALYYCLSDEGLNYFETLYNAFKAFGLLHAAAIDRYLAGSRESGSSE